MPVRSQALYFHRIAAAALALIALWAAGAAAQTSPGLNLDALVGKTPRISGAELGVKVLTGGTPKLADLAFGQGLAHMQKGNLAKAIDTLRLAAAGRPDNAAFRAVLGDAYMATGTPDAVVVALDQFQTAVRLDPSAVHAREGLAEAAWLTGDADAAITNLEKLYLGDGKALREQYAGRLSTRYILARKIDRGIVTFAKAYPRSKKPSAVLLLLATLSMQKQDKESARALVEKVLAAEPAGSTLALQAKHMLEQGIGP